MCGITGFIDFKCKSNKGILSQMTDTLSHRGPSDAGVVLVENEMYQVGLGHRRLSIIDLSILGHQPFYDDTNSAAIIFNGEIYNYKAIKEQLIAAGVNFRSNSDTEVVLKSFQLWGKEAIKQFIGMFAFAIYDFKKHKIFIYRDRAGVKPVYYYQKDGLFMFSSELKAFHKHPQFSKSINRDAFAMYMQYGYVPTPHAIFEHTYKLKPGHLLEIDLVKQFVEEEEYWNVLEAYNKPKLNISEQEAEEETENLLKSAFEYRMVADVPVGVFLSGGYDSSIVAAMLQSNRTEKIKTFTIGFHEKGFNEAEYAKVVANHLGTDHTEYYCTQKDALDIIPKLPVIFDEPFGDSSAIPTTLVSKLAREQVTVSLSADAGDEIFGGYNKYMDALKYYRLFSKFPRRMNTYISQMMDFFPAKKIPLTSKVYNFESRYEKMKVLLGAKSVVNTMQYISQQLTKKEIDSFVKGGINEPHIYFDDFNAINRFNDDINKMLVIDYKTYMIDDILVKVDRATMSVSLEGREPLLDHRIVEFVAQLPSSLKIKDGNKKYLLKKITHKYLPKSIMDRPKMGFGVPIVQWFNKELREYFNEYLNPERLKRHGMYDSEEVGRWLKDYTSGKNVDVTRLWFILMFEMWYDEWM